jgi:DNA-binding transcriptional MocR family regulator
MSFQAMTGAFAVKGLSASEKLVLLALSNYADREMRCFPSQGALAEDTELSERTVWSAVKALEERGVLTREARHRADGSRTTDVFTLHFNVEVTETPPRKICEPPSQDLHPPLATVAPPPATVASLTTYEPVTRGSYVEDKSSTPQVVQIDPDREAWEQAVSTLRTAHRLTEAQARTFFGKLLSQNALKPRDLLASIASCRANQTPDPRAYLTKAAQSINRRRSEPRVEKRVGFV